VAYGPNIAVWRADEDDAWQSYWAARNAIDWMAPRLGQLLGKAGWI